MPVWVCLLRGVNLGKQRKLPMPALRKVLTDAGMTDVRTYLQSGNVVARSQLRSHRQVSHLVRTAIAAEFSLDVPVMTRRPAEIDDVIASNPFAAEAAQRAHLVRVIFLAAIPQADRISALMADNDLRQTCRVIGSHVYVDYVRGYHNTGRTAPYFTRALGIDGTERNWRTVLALSVLCAEGRPSVRLETERDSDSPADVPLPALGIRGPCAADSADRRGLPSVACGQPRAAGQVGAVGAGPARA